MEVYKFLREPLLCPWYLACRDDLVTAARVGDKLVHLSDELQCPQHLVEVDLPGFHLVFAGDFFESASFRLHLCLVLADCFKSSLLRVYHRLSWRGST